MNFRVLIIISFMSLAIAPGFAAGAEQVSFSWAFLLKAENSQTASLAFDGPEQVSTGQLLRIYLELHNRSFIYLFLLDSRADLYMVFPPNSSFYNGDLPIGYKTYIPSGHEWFALDTSQGIERFYLLVSNERLHGLEELTDAFMVSRARGIKVKLLKELDILAGQFSLAANPEIKWVSINHGNSLSIDKSMAEANAQRILATGSYGKILDLVNR